jgi:hypothetical protein
MSNMPISENSRAPILIHPHHRLAVIESHSVKLRTIAYTLARLGRFDLQEILFDIADELEALAHRLVSHSKGPEIVIRAQRLIDALELFVARTAPTVTH